MSVISITLMVFLFLNELSAFVQIKTSSEMLVDLNRSSDHLIINLDITLHRLPCQIISLDLQDIMGTHSLNIGGKLFKNRLDKNGLVLGVMEHFKNKPSVPARVHGHDNHSNDSDMSDYEEIKKAVQNGEGCKLVGTIQVLRVPGNFHISSHAYGNIIARLAAENIYDFDISHTVNHLSFGDESHVKYIKNNFEIGKLDPIDNTYKKQTKEHKIYEYYLKVVPTTYTNIKGETFNVHQFTANSNDVSAEMMVPTIFFRYDISPILVKIVQYKQGFFHFFIQICAIIGGIFTVTGILDTVIHKVSRKVKDSQ